MHAEARGQLCGAWFFSSHLYVGPRDRTWVIRFAQQALLLTKPSRLPSLLLMDRCGVSFVHLLSTHIIVWENYPFKSFAISVGLFSNYYFENTMFVLTMSALVDT